MNKQYNDLTDRIKISTPLSTSAVLSIDNDNDIGMPAGSFKPELLENTIRPLLGFLGETGSPLMVNVNPISNFDPEYLKGPWNPDYKGPGQPRVAAEYYICIFDTILDRFVEALNKEGYGSGRIRVLVTETGFPTDGEDHGGIGTSPFFSVGEKYIKEIAKEYHSIITSRVLNGTNLRPGVLSQVYLRSLFDEKWRAGEAYDQHYGIFRNDGTKKYDINFN
ncbi:Glycoside hydrolase [Macleaya cordata]|uniref:Glycoside hydrolase n=1 Tax=Macleaya cordata TaxID=56857 RepID=A0A200R2V7_MACCD|nr:Glycoside hydrolase [Macleaya cordata]